MLYLFLFLAVLVLLIAFVAMQSGNFRISRSVVVMAPPEAVFPHINDFHQWVAWSPWEKLDPNTKRTFGGSPQGVGATYAWVGNKNVGAGNMQILESNPNEIIRLALNFEVPFKANHMTDFTFKPEGAGTLVTQTMYGKNGFMGKAIHLMMDMDKKMIGPQFEKGLNDLKAIVETAK